LTDEQLVAALEKAAATLRERHGRLDVKYGDVFRVGRQGSELSFPVGGGSLKEAGMATPRAISFGGPQKNLRIGHGGQTSTQVVVLSNPPKSYMVIPLGESDHPDSGHWLDQGQKLFSHAKAKDTYFLDREGLKPHVTKTVTLEH
jgi:acyl-homoserine lactone acylase PvdQ